MATLAEQRRAIQARNTAARKASDGAAARRASGQAMIERRTGKQQVDDINAVVAKQTARKTLKTVEPRGALVGQIGTGSYTAPATGTGGGVASPLTETADSREYHAEPVVISSTDGSLYMSVLMPARVTMLDAEGREIIFEYRRQ